MAVKRTNKAPMDIRMVGYEAVEKVAMPSGTSARILVPKHWIGKRVKVIRVEP
jgi:putative transposon-encoded protein